MEKGKYAQQISRPRRLFVADIPSAAEEIFLTGDEKRYVCNVLRMEAGDPLVLFDSSGWEYSATIIEAASRHVKLKIYEKQRGQRDAPVEILLGIGLIKAQKMDLVVQKAVELGVHGIYPVKTKRSVPVFEPRRAEQKLKRWQKIAQDASRQCGRATVAEIYPVIPFGQMVEKARSLDLALLFSSETDGLPQKNDKQGEGIFNRIIILVGPEGGFTFEEEQIAQEKGFFPIGLGPRILRAETAAILAVGLVQFQFGDLGFIKNQVVHG